MYSGGTSKGLGYSAAGGECGSESNYINGGKGGSGGGDGGTYRVTSSTMDYDRGGYGGSDGSNGTAASNRYGNNTLVEMEGQGTTTRAFGESDGTLYSGGGGGAARIEIGSDGGGTGGQGGDGGGGAGCWYSSMKSSSKGSTNTGGGGGGNSYYTGFTDISNSTSIDSYWGNKVYGGNGGSGIVIIRWGY